jgi:hypothetical protein
MVKPLLFQLGEQQFALEINKVDRSRLYGSKEIQVVDDKEQPCELATLADDGHTIIGRGGTGILWLDADGRCCEKSQLKPVDVHGQVVQSVESSFGTTIKLFDTATPEQLLDHNIRLVYEVQPVDLANDLIELQRELSRGTIFTFPYSFRGGLEADTGFLIANEEGQLMLLIGDPANITYAAVQAPALIEAVDQVGDGEVETDAMSFDMI